MTDRPAYRPTGQTLSVEGRKVHVLVRGHGPDLILLHGASGNLRDFAMPGGLIDHLAGRYRVIAFDRPGLGHTPPIGDSGDSPAAQAALLDAAAGQLGVGRAVVLGHSYGGAVALAWALDHPDRVAGLVVLSGATMPWPGELGPWYDLAATRFGGSVVLPLVSALAPRGLADGAARAVFAPQLPPPDYPQKLGVELTLRPVSLRANARQVGRLKADLLDMAPRYDGLRLPVEVVHGTADAVVPARVHAAPLARVLPAGKLTLLPGIGHMPHHTAPEQVAAAIDRAMQRAGMR